MKLIVAIIQTCKKHPEATKLNICEVYDGISTHQVVCGAANAKAGMKTVFAPVGSTTPKGLNIKEATLRGTLSSGMLCSAKDLDISNEDGIIDLPEEIAIGTKLANIPTEYLSSTPWHTFKCVDSIWENIETKKLLVVKKNEENPDKNKYRLLSQTYYENNQYRYRHFKV